MRNACVLASTLTLTVGCVSGLVLDENGNPIVGADVTIYDCLEPGCYSAQVTTDFSGRYTYSPYVDGDAIPDLPYFNSNDTFDFGMVIVVEGTKTPGSGDICHVQEEVVKVHIPVYQQDSSSGQYFTQVEDIRVDKHTYNIPYGCINTPNYAPDQDWDGLADALENYYGTSATDPDSDDDGIKDGVEVRGADQDLTGYSVTREWYPEIDYAHYGATPTHRDHFIQWDYQRIKDDNNVTQQLYPVQELRDHYLTFFEGHYLLSNPDGNDGMRMHIIPGEIIGPQSGTPVLTGFAPLNSPMTIPDRRLFSHLQQVVVFAGWSACSNPGCAPAPTIFNNNGFSCNQDGNTNGTTPNTYRGLAAYDGDVAHVCVFNPWPSSNFQNSGRVHDAFETSLHEWGHQMGLRHGGDNGQNCKPNYPSIMNYGYENFLGKGTLATDKTQFSVGSWPDLNENAVAEIDPLYPLTVFDMAPLEYSAFQYDVIAGGMGCTGNQQCVDWDGSGAITSGTYQMTLRPDCEGTQSGFITMEDYDDVSRIVQELPNQLNNNGPHLTIPGQPRGMPKNFTPDLVSVDMGPIDPDTRESLEDITGREGVAMERFVESAGFDLDRDEQLLRRFRNIRGSRNLVLGLAQKLFPDGVPGYLSNDELEAEVKKLIKRTMETEIGYAPDVELVECKKPGETLAGLKTLVDLVHNNRRGHGAAHHFGSRSLEDAAPSLSESGLVRLCR